MALLDYVKRITPNSLERQNWKIFTRSKGVKPNSIYYARVTNPSSRFTDFAFIVNNKSNGESRTALYSFADDETPQLVTDQYAPAGANITKIKNSYGSYIFYY